MIPITDNERRRAFSIWLRTGRLPSVAIADDVELKFNPWHDPADGQFTFAGSGRNYGQSGGGGFRSSGGSGGGASSREDWPREARSATNRQRPRPGLTPTAKTSGSSPRPSPNTNAQRPISNNSWGGGALRETVVTASAVRGRRAIGASIRQSSGRVRKPHRPPRSSKHQYRRQRQPSVPAPRDHFVARSAAATNIKSTRRDEPAEC